MTHELFTLTACVLIALSLGFFIGLYAGKRRGVNVGWEIGRCYQIDVQRRRYKRDRIGRFSAKDAQREFQNEDH